VTKRRTSAFAAALTAVLLLAGLPAVAIAGVPSEDEEPEVVLAPGGDVVVGDGRGDRVPLLLVPSGCEAPQLPELVFEGEVLDTDDRSARFRIDHVRAGDPGRYRAGDEIEIRYGIESQYLGIAETYLVAAGREPSLGLLYSRVGDPAPLFGGDDIVGLAEPDIDCPEFADPVMTLRPDGRVLTTSVLGSFLSDSRALASAVLVPFGLAVGVLVAVAVLSLGLRAIGRSLRRNSG
jgi:hypothetical protein